MPLVFFTLFNRSARARRWSEEGAVGQYRFLGRIWRIVTDLLEHKAIEPYTRESRPR
ncbi:MAG: hypothetical protein R3C24_14545 [Cyanobacteriota/Melainabacteria group bacterium]